MAVKQTAGRDSLGEFAPKFAELNDDVLFGEVWSREDKLSLRDRSLVTVIALMAQGLTDSSLNITLCQQKRTVLQNGNCRNSHTRRILCRLAKGLGSIQNGYRSMG